MGFVVSAVEEFAESEHPANTAIERAIVPSKTLFLIICFTEYLLYFGYRDRLIM